MVSSDYFHWWNHLPLSHLPSIISSVKVMTIEKRQQLRHPDSPQLSALLGGGGDIQCIRKVFTVLNFFHILLCYSLIPKSNKFIIFLKNLQTIPHTNKVKEVCLNSLQIYEKEKKSHVHKYSQPLPWHSKLSSSAFCLHRSSLRCFYNLIGVHLW